MRIGAMADARLERFAQVIVSIHGALAHTHAVSSFRLLDEDDKDRLLQYIASCIERERYTAQRVVSRAKEKRDAAKVTDGQVG